MKTTLIIITALLTSIAVFAQQGQSIKVKVKNISSETGQVFISLFNSEETFLNVPFKSKSLQATAEELVFEFDELNNGDYTISVYHDLNNNGELDKNFIGIPSEPYGISMKGKNMFGPPSYSEAIFTVSDKELELTITL